MKILIAGSKGQLGLELARQLSPGPHEIVETDCHNMDITDRPLVTQVMEALKPDVIINCAAYTNVDSCESNESTAYRVNAIGARNLAASALKINSAILQLSTDYVFDGSGSSPIREYEQVKPINNYGKSKALGEALVREVNPRHFIIRTAWLYGDGGNFVRTMLKLAKTKTTIEVVNDQTGTPTSTAELARCIIRLIGSDCYGTYHATCEGWCTWFDFAVKIFKHMKMDIEVRSISSEQLKRPAARPGYSVLDNFMLKLQDMNSFRYWEDALEEYLKL
jgi:dTDP-4-dehydrorhamnose reductase